MSILITGGLGFIGGRLANYLKGESDSEIYLTTRKKDRDLPAWTKDFNVLQMDVCDEQSIFHCLDESKPDTIVHLGAVHQSKCLESLELALDINTKGTYRLLNYAHRAGVSRFIYVSTFQVYGNLAGDITEKTVANPANPYSISKRCAEYYVSFFRDQYQMQTLTLRLSNVYGFPMDKDVNVWQLAFNSFCRQCVENGKIVIKSNQYRDFIAMEDVVRGIHHFLADGQDHWDDGLFNLGGDCCLSVHALAQKVADIYQKNCQRESVAVECPKEDAGIIMKQPFHYNIEKLKNTGFQLTGNMVEETVRSVNMCGTVIKEKV